MPILKNKIIKKIIISSLIIIPILAISKLDTPPVKDILFMNKNGELVSGIRCATKDISDDPNIKKSIDNISKWRQNNPIRDKLVTIPIAFHVITNDNGEGNVSDDRLLQQVAALNSAYENININFNIKSIDRTKNNFYYNAVPGIQEYIMKYFLNIDPANILNIYINKPGDNILGFATFPWMYSESNFLHGVVILNESLPGGTAENYNLGKTAVHEIGHYMGLYHTFNNGCAAPGDMVDDTPYHANANYGCPVGTDTCAQEGLDPVYNFMNYTYDTCMDSFTDDQFTRVDWALTNYKPSLIN